MCVDNSEWTRNGDYAPTRFQVRGWVCGVCVRSAARSLVVWSVEGAPSFLRFAAPRARCFSRSLSFFFPKRTRPHSTTGPGRRGQPAGRRQDAGQPGKRGGRPDHGGQGAAGAGHADARPRARAQCDAGKREGKRDGADVARARHSVSRAPEGRRLSCSVARAGGTKHRAHARARSSFIASSLSQTRLSLTSPSPLHPHSTAPHNPHRTSPSRATPTCHPPSRSPSSPSNTGPTSTSASGSSCLWVPLSRRMRPRSSRSVKN